MLFLMNVYALASSSQGYVGGETGDGNSGYLFLCSGKSLYIGYLGDSVG
jgi:hypothetical protein